MVLGSKLGSSAHMWNFPGKLQITTERGRYLKADLDKKTEKKRQAGFPRMPSMQGTGDVQGQATSVHLTPEVARTAPNLT